MEGFSPARNPFSEDDVRAGPASLSSSREAERVARPTLLPKLELGRGGALEPAPPGLRGAEAREGSTEVSATPFCFCSKSALAVGKIVQEPRKDGIPSHMRPSTVRQSASVLRKKAP